MLRNMRGKSFEYKIIDATNTQSGWPSKQKRRRTNVGLTDFFFFFGGGVCAWEWWGYVQNERQLEIQVLTKVD